MTVFNCQNDKLFLEDLSLQFIAETYRTPCYVYSKTAVVQAYQKFKSAFKPNLLKVYYAVKANSNLSILQILHQLGAGFDIVSIGQFYRVLAAGGQAEHMVFSGIGKTEEELRTAIQANIGCINIESSSELKLINELSLKLNKKTRVALRVNPNIDAKTHPFISTGLAENKFGIEVKVALELYNAMLHLPGIQPIGVACHIGSQITTSGPFKAAAKAMQKIVNKLTLMGIRLEHVDMGGGLGVPYQNELCISPKEYAEAIGTPDHNLALHLEPGRFLLAKAGILLTQVLYLKKTQNKNFCIVDAAMNDCMRPCLYDAYQGITPVMKNITNSQDLYDIVGPICETTDFLAKDRHLAIQEGDYLALEDVGAYGYSMASNYNSRPKPLELMVEGNQIKVINKRENIKDLIRCENEQLSKS